MKPTLCWCVCFNMYLVCLCVILLTTQVRCGKIKVCLCLSVLCICLFARVSLTILFASLAVIKAFNLVWLGQVQSSSTHGFKLMSWKSPTSKQGENKCSVCVCAFAWVCVCLCACACVCVCLYITCYASVYTGCFCGSVWHAYVSMFLQMDARICTWTLSPFSSSFLLLSLTCCIFIISLSNQQPNKPHHRQPYILHPYRLYTALCVPYHSSHKAIALLLHHHSAHSIQTPSVSELWKRPSNNNHRNIQTCRFITGRNIY